MPLLRRPFRCSARLLAAGLVVGVGLQGAAARGQGESAVAAGDNAPFLFTAARLLAAEPDQQEEALGLFERAVELDPEAPYLRIGLAQFLVELRRFAHAADQAAAAFELAPDDVEVLRAYAQTQLSLPDRSIGDGLPGEAVERARDALTRLRELAPSDIEGMLLLARIHGAMEQPGEAASVLEELVSYHNGNRQLKGLLIDALRRAGRGERAQELLAEMLRLDENNLDASMELAQQASRQGEHSKAIELLEAAAERNPASIRVQGALAEEYFRRGVARVRTPQQRSRDLDDALRRVRALPEAARSTPAGQLLLARILGESDRVAEAIEVLDVLWRELPDDPQVQREFARRLMQEGRWDRVRQVGRRLADRADRSQPDGARQLQFGLSLVVEAFRRLGEPERAIEVLAGEEARSGETIELVLSQAELLAEAGMRRRALAMLRRDIVANDRLLEPGEDGEAEVEALTRKAELYVDLEAERLARAAYDDLAAGDDVRRLMLAADSRRSQLQFEEAIPYLLRALAAVDSGQDTGLDVEESALRAALLFQLGEAHERSRDYDQAAVRFREVIEMQPENSHALNYLGYMWADNNENLEQALELIRRAVDLDPNNGAFVDSLGWALFRLGEFEQARRHLERAQQLVPRDPTILEHLGDVYLALGDSRRAREAYEQALEINDEENVESVRRKLSELSRR